MKESTHHKVKCRGLKISFKMVSFPESLISEKSLADTTHNEDTDWHRLIVNKRRNFNSNEYDLHKVLDDILFLLIFMFLILIFIQTDVSNLYPAAPLHLHIWVKTPAQRELLRASNLLSWNELWDEWSLSCGIDSPVQGPGEGGGGQRLTDGWWWGW